MPLIRPRSLASALLAATLSAAAGLAGLPAAAQQQAGPRPAPGVWNYVAQDGLHKATVLDLSGFFQVQCKEAKVSIVVLVNSEGPLPTGGRKEPLSAQMRFEGQTIPITMTEQQKYASVSGPIHTTVYLVSVQGRGPDILNAIKKAHAFLIDQGPVVFAYSSKGSGAAISELEKGCAAR